VRHPRGGAERRLAGEVWPELSNHEKGEKRCRLQAISKGEVLGFISLHRRGLLEPSELGLVVARTRPPGEAEALGGLDGVSVSLTPPSYCANPASRASIRSSV